MKGEEEGEEYRGRRRRRSRKERPSKFFGLRKMYNTFSVTLLIIAKKVKLCQHLIH